MDFKEYISHYLTPKDMLIYLGEALGGLIISILFLILFIKLLTLSVDKNKRKAVYRIHLKNSIERFYEVIFSGASILSFLAVYYLIDRFLDIAKYRTFWDSNKDFLLLLMICLSIVLNNLVDRILIPLKNITKEERASVRIVGMIYVILIFIYIKYIYENNNYDGFIMYFLGLMIGRFVYFDASFKDTLRTLKSAIDNIPMMILGLGYTGYMCLLGFGSKYLRILNGVLVSTFIAHLYMIVAIFIIYHSHVLDLITYNKENKRKGRKEPTK